VSLGGGAGGDASGDDAVAFGDGVGKIGRELWPFLVSPRIHLWY